MGKKRITAKSAAASRKNKKPAAGNKFRIIKGAVLLAAAGLALGAGIYKGGEGLFFGVVFALACGLVGVLYIKQDNGTARMGRK